MFAAPTFAVFATGAIVGHVVAEACQHEKVVGELDLILQIQAVPAEVTVDGKGGRRINRPDRHPVYRREDADVVEEQTPYVTARLISGLCDSNLLPEEGCV